MRKFILLVSALVLQTISLNAQSVPISHTVPEDNNRNEEGKVQRSRFITNEWYDNWVFQVYGGAQTMISGYADKGNTGFDFGTAVITPAIDLSLTKWITPAAAVRFGIQGLKLTENRTMSWNFNHYIPKHDDTRMYYGQTYMHADIMLSVTNFIWGYKETRFYNCTPYFHSGYLRLFQPDEGIFTKNQRDREVEMGLGVLNTFRIADHIALNIDVRWGNFAGRFHDVNNGGRVNNFAALAGVSYTIHKWYWDRFSTAAKGYETAIAAEKALRAANERKLAQAQKDLEDAQKALEDQKSELMQRLLDEQKKQDQKNQSINLGDTYINPENIPASSDTVVIKDELLVRMAASDLVLFYPINVDKLTAQEAYRLDMYVKAIREQDPNHVFYITGSADKGTGNTAINTRLSKARAENIKKLLMKKYGIPESQIVIKATIISDKHEDGRLDRCTLLENE